MFQFSRKSIRQCSSALAAVLLLSTTSALAADRTFAFQIPKENTAQALNDFAKQAGVQILFPYEVAAAHTAPAVSGQFTRAEALARIIRDTGLEVFEQTDTAITLRAAPTATPGKPEASVEPVQEVIVTGTHIRGGNPTSPVHTVSRADIEQSGYSQIGDVIRSLPENFNGGQNPGVIGAVNANPANQNISNASTVNLRGLGSDSTLVLINGHRIAADTGFQGIDVSVIPIDAVQRVEVVTDGASAIYGSDAVGGVANFVLRKNYNGLQTGATLGGATQGGGFQQIYNVLTGRSGADWSALVNVEYSKQSEINAGQRAFTSAAPPVETLQPAFDKTSIYANFNRQIGDRADFTLDALVSSRDSQNTNKFSNTATAYFNSTATKSQTVAPGLNYRLTDTWRLRLDAVASGTENTTATRTATQQVSTYRYKNGTESAEVAVDGPAITLPSGSVSIAIGAGYRRETFTGGYGGSEPDVKHSRSITYAFFESLVPFVTPSSERTGLHELELSLSARNEDYSNLGNTTNPRVGLRYRPWLDLTLRATAGRSFKAPMFIQMYSASDLYGTPADWFSGPSGKDALLKLGGNPDLKPETAKTWTVSGEYTPASVTGLTLAVTYFNIDYTNRVVQPISPWTYGLTDPSFAEFVTAFPSDTVQAAAISGATNFYDYTNSGYDAANVVALLDDRYLNASSQKIEGADVAYRQTFSLGTANLNLFANGTWLTLRQKTISSLPLKTLSGTIFNPPKFRGRAGVTWTKDGLTVTALANYLSEETDTGMSTPTKIGSWTTVDTNIAYIVPSTNKTFNGLRLSLSASNLFDKDPPYAASPALLYKGLSYDSTNTSIVGRFISVSISKAW